MKHIFCIAIILLLSLDYVQAAEVPFIELKGHTGGVISARYSPDGKTIITIPEGSHERNHRLWNAESGEALGTLSDVTSAQYSPDGTLILARSGGPIVRILDSETGMELLTLRHSWAVASALWSPDGMKIATITVDRDLKSDVRIWDTDSGTVLRRLELPDTSTFLNGFSPDGKKIATRHWDYTARIWDVESGEELLTLTGHTRSLNAVVFSPDGKQIVTSSNGFRSGEPRGGTIRIWDAETGKELHKLTEQTRSIGHARFSPDGKKVVAIIGFNVHMWDTESGKELQTLEGGHFVVFSPDGKRIVTGSREDIAVIWDVESGRELQKLVGHTRSFERIAGGSVYSAAFSLDGKKVVTASGDGTARIWTLE